jgi:hypothetical protein
MISLGFFFFLSRMKRKISDFSISCCSSVIFKVFFFRLCTFIASVNRKENVCFSCEQ